MYKNYIHIISKLWTFSLNVCSYASQPLFPSHSLPLVFHFVVVKVDHMQFKPSIWDNIQLHVRPGLVRKLLECTPNCTCALRRTMCWTNILAKFHILQYFVGIKERRARTHRQNVDHWKYAAHILCSNDNDDDNIDDNNHFHFLHILSLQIYLFQCSHNVFLLLNNNVHCCIMSKYKI